MNLLRCIFTFLLLSGLARATEPVALLQPGEVLTYRVGWGVIGSAGEMKVVASTDMIDGQPRTRVTTSSSTRGLVRMLYSFDGEAQTFFDPRDGRLLTAQAITRSSKDKTHASISFDYEKAEASYVDHLQPERTKIMPLPPGGHPMDLITALMQTRIWVIGPGESRDVLVLFDDDFYSLRITAFREETIQTPKGPRKALHLVPTMLGKPKGMFRRGGEVHVWVSADAERLPLRFEVKLKVGTAFAVLTDYKPAPLPAPTAPAPEPIAGL